MLKEMIKLSLGVFKVNLKIHGYRTLKMMTSFNALFIKKPHNEKISVLFGEMCYFARVRN